MLLHDAFAWPAAQVVQMFALNGVVTDKGNQAMQWCRQQKGACRPVRVNGARDITRLMAQTAIQVRPPTVCNFMTSIHPNVHLADCICFLGPSRAPNITFGARKAFQRCLHITYAFSQDCELTQDTDQHTLVLIAFAHLAQALK